MPFYHFSSQWLGFKKKLAKVTQWYKMGISAAPLLPCHCHKAIYSRSHHTKKSFNWKLNPCIELVRTNRPVDNGIRLHCPFPFRGQCQAMNAFDDAPNFGLSCQFWYIWDLLRNIVCYRIKLAKQNKLF